MGDQWAVVDGQMVQITYMVPVSLPRMVSSPYEPALPIVDPIETLPPSTPPHNPTESLPVPAVQSDMDDDDDQDAVVIVPEGCRGPTSQMTPIRKTEVPDLVVTDFYSGSTSKPSIKGVPDTKLSPRTTEPSNSQQGYDTQNVQQAANDAQQSQNQEKENSIAREYERQQNLTPGKQKSQPFVKEVSPVQKESVSVQQDISNSSDEQIDKSDKAASSTSTSRNSGNESPKVGETDSARRRSTRTAAKNVSYADMDEDEDEDDRERSRSQFKKKKGEDIVTSSPGSRRPGPGRSIGPGRHPGRQSNSSNTTCGTTEKYTCAISSCNASFSKDFEVYVHWNHYHDFAAICFSCTDCESVKLWPREPFIGHIIREHNIPYVIGLDEIKQQGSRYVDPIDIVAPDGYEAWCNETIMPKRKGHMAVKWKETGLKCPVQKCIFKDETFTDPVDFYNHWKLVHIVFVPHYVCKSCSAGSRFCTKYKETLKKHIEYKHVKHELEENFSKYYEVLNSRNLEFIDPYPYIIDNRSADANLFKVNEEPEEEVVEILSGKTSSATRAPVSANKNYVKPKITFRTLRRNATPKSDIEAKNSEEKLATKAQEGNHLTDVFFNDNTRIYTRWSDSGVECPVPDCHSLLLKTHKDVIKHWKEIHVENFVTYECPACAAPNPYTSSRLGQLFKHIRTEHLKNTPNKDKDRAMNDIWKAVKPTEKTNKFYKDPRPLQLLLTEDKAASSPSHSQSNDSEAEENTSARPGPVNSSVICPATNCVETFSDVPKFKAHWKLMHMPIAESLMCPLCRSPILSRPMLCTHLEGECVSRGVIREGDKSHLVDTANHCIFRNLEYTDPGKFCCTGDILQAIRQVKAELKASQALHQQPGIDIPDWDMVSFNSSTFKINCTNFLKDDRPKKRFKFITDMKCPVNSCSAKLADKRTLEGHWMDFHVPYSQNYNCPVSENCARDIKNFHNVETHLKEFHMEQCKKISTIVKLLRSAKVTVVQNDNYIDPCEVLPPTDIEEHLSVQTKRGDQPDTYDSSDDDGSGQDDNDAMDLGGADDDTDDVDNIEPPLHAEKPDEPKESKPVPADVKKENKVVEWHPSGVRCPVENCVAKSVFKRKESLCAHWMAFHEAKVEYYTCLVCQHKAQVHNMKLHLYLAHKDNFGDAEAIEKALKDCLKKKQVNPEYLNPAPWTLADDLIAQLSNTEVIGSSRSPFPKVQSPYASPAARSKSPATRSKSPAARSPVGGSPDPLPAPGYILATFDQLKPVKSRCPVKNCDIYISGGSSSFKTHWRNKHEKENPQFVCPLCPEKSAFLFRGRRDLENHLGTTRHLGSKTPRSKIQAIAAKVELQILPNRSYIAPWVLPLHLKAPSKELSSTAAPESVKVKSRATARKSTSKKSNAARETPPASDSPVPAVINENVPAGYHVMSNEEAKKQPMPGKCPVIDCKEYVHANYLRHWEICHKAASLYYACPFCPSHSRFSIRASVDINSMKRHMLTSHPESATENCLSKIIKVMRKNPKYVQPLVVDNNGNAEENNVVGDEEGQGTQDEEVANDAQLEPEDDNGDEEEEEDDNAESVASSNSHASKKTKKEKTHGKLLGKGRLIIKGGAEFRLVEERHFEITENMVCPILDCGVQISSRLIFKRHWKNKHTRMNTYFYCPLCPSRSKFYVKERTYLCNLRKHMEAIHNAPTTKVEAMMQKLKGKVQANSTYIRPIIPLSLFNEIEEAQNAANETPDPILDVNTSPKKRGRPPKNFMETPEKLDKQDLSQSPPAKRKRLDDSLNATSERPSRTQKIENTNDAQEVRQGELQDPNTIVVMHKLSDAEIAEAKRQIKRNGVANIKEAIPGMPKEILKFNPFEAMPTNETGLQAYITWLRKMEAAAHFASQRLQFWKRNKLQAGSSNSEANTSVSTDSDLQTSVLPIKTEEEPQETCEKKSQDSPNINNISDCAIPVLKPEQRTPKKSQPALISATDVSSSATNITSSDDLVSSLDDSNILPVCDSAVSTAGTTDSNSSEPVSRVNDSITNVKTESSPVKMLRINQTFSFGIKADPSLVEDNRSQDNEQSDENVMETKDSDNSQSEAAFPQAAMQTDTQISNPPASESNSEFSTPALPPDTSSEPMDTTEDTSHSEICHSTAQNTNTATEHPNNTDPNINNISTEHPNNTGEEDNQPGVVPTIANEDSLKDTF